LHYPQRHGGSEPAENQPIGPLDFVHKTIPPEPRVSVAV
jgi:hypothetical protein